MAESVLWAAEALSLAVGRQTLYNDAEFSISSGERVGLIGRNGSGKSTLLRLIHGDEPAPEGALITRARNLQTALLRQEFSLDGSRTIAENVSDGLARFRELQHRFETVPVNSPEHGELEHLLMLHDAWNRKARTHRPRPPLRHAFRRRKAPGRARPRDRFGTRPAAARRTDQPS